MRPLAPNFKTYIFGILAQFVTIWHQQKRWVFFSITDPFRTHVTGFVLVYFSFTLRSISLFNSAKKRRQRKIISSLLGQTADLFAGRQILPRSNQTLTSSCEGENINWILQDSNFSNGFIGRFGHKS